MKIGAPALLTRDGTREYRAHVSWSKGSHTLWYRVEERLADLLTTSSDAALVALLIPAMATGEDIHLEGEVSERLYHSLAGPYQDLLRAVIPPLHRIAIHASGFQAPRARPAAVATGLSCGIDSYCLLLDHFFAEDPVGGKVTHLLFNNVGSHGKDGERVFRQRLARVTPVAARIGLPLVAVDSNLDEFYGAGLSFIQTHTPRNASVALLLQGGIGQWLYAAGYSNDTMFVGPTHEIAAADGVALPMLCTESLEITLRGGEYTRAQKTLRVAGLPLSYDTLDVCANPVTDRNCSICQKCLRTLLTLEIAGHLGLYARAFDLDAYRGRRGKYAAKVLRSRNRFDKDVVDLAVERGFAFPLRSYAASPLHAAGYLARRSLRHASR
ncbi:MAG TPA: hypothetical protein PLI70_03840 [Gemmatimonadales bacterium]|nr:hypothetical protein [Gemmatimonadales bacterium]HRZ08941.1 hypothetical protein [Gemmatimonadales bacterium]